MIERLPCAVIFVLNAFSAVVLTGALGRSRSLRQRRLLLISIAALANAAVWTAASILSDVAAHMDGYKWGMPLQCFMEFDFFAIISFFVALLAAPRPKETDS